MSTVAAAPERARPENPMPSPPGARGPRGVFADVILAVCLSAGLLAVAFVTSGGVDQTSATTGNTWTEIVLTLLGAGAMAAAVLYSSPPASRGRAWGAGTVGLMAALTALTALSILWSVVPDTSWSAANQMLSYLAVFAGAAALARLAPGRWPTLLAAVALTTAAISGWALLAKVFPATLAPDNTYGRLQAPFGYYNAVGILGALGLPACLWAATRRDRGRLVAGLAAPAIALTLSAVLLSSSRSADVAAVVVAVAWLVFVPLRLRSAAMLAIGGAGAAAISAWPLSHSVLTADGALTPAMDSAGHTFGLVLAIVLTLVTAAGAACAWAMDHRAVSAGTRRRVGTGLVVLACLIPVAAVGAVATSSRGLTGEISHAWTTLTSTRGGATNAPTRVLEFGSSRPLYWHEGLDVGSHALLKGVGASGYGTARLRYTTNPAKSDQAHSYIIETFADLGLIGIAITLALLVAWAIAAARPLAIRSGWSPLPAEQHAERVGMVALAVIVIGFGTQSALDWTWYFPGVSVPVLLCAGWLAGRGPLAVPVGWLRSRRSLLDRPGSVALMAAVAAIAVAGAWMQWQPQRSADRYDAAVTTASNAGAVANARAAIGNDPLALGPRFLLAQLYQASGDLPMAREQLLSATRLQPQNPLSWAHLARFDLAVGYPRRAFTEASRALALDQPADPTHAAATAVFVRAQAVIASQLIERAHARTASAHRASRQHSAQ